MTTNSNKVKTYHFFLAGLLCVMLVLTLVLGWLVELSPLHVTYVELRGEHSNAEYIEQSITLKWSRPLKPDQAALFHLSPATKMQVAINGDEVKINFLEPLTPETAYVLAVEAGLEDIYAKTLTTGYTLDFTTVSRKVAFQRPTESTVDEIVVADENLDNQQTIYSAPNIKAYDASADYLAVISSPEQYREQLQVKNIRTGDIKSVDVGDAMFTDIDISPTAPQLLFTAQPVAYQSGIAVPLDAHSLYIYDLITNSWDLVEFKFEVTDMMDVKFTPDGEAFVAKMVTGEYFLVSLADSTQYINLGAHIDLASISSANDAIIYLDLPTGGATATDVFAVANMLNSNRSVITLSTGQYPIVDPVFLFDSTQFVFAKLRQSLEGSRGLYDIYLQQVETGVQELIISDVQASLELPAPSRDGKLLGVEKYTPEELVNYLGMRSLGYQTKPSKADLVIVDMATKEIVGTTPGFNLVWIR